MAVINLTLPNDELAVTGKLVSFIAPCDSDSDIQLNIEGKLYNIVDSANTPLTKGSFLKGAVVSVLLNVEDLRAYVQGVAVGAKLQEHIDKRVLSEEGVHGLRFYDGKFQVLVDGVWVDLDISSTKQGTTVAVTCDAKGSNFYVDKVTATDGVQTVEVEGSIGKLSYDVKIPNFGVWRFYVHWRENTTSSIKDAMLSNAQEIAVYEDGLSLHFEWFTATLRIYGWVDKGVKYHLSHMSPLCKGTYTYNHGPAGESYWFTIDNAGTHKLYLEYEGVKSEEIFIDIVEHEKHYSVYPRFRTLDVTSDIGSIILVTGTNGYSCTKTSVETITTFYLPQDGVYTVYITSPTGKSFSSDVTVIGFGKAESVVAEFTRVYGVSIDLTNSDPESCVTYTDEAVGMIAGSSDWDSKPVFKNIKPCAFKDGKVLYYLNPNNFNQKEDGTDAEELLTQTSPSYGTDVMIEIPKVGVKIETVGDTLTVKITDDPDASSQGFHYYAHTRDRNNEGDREKLYIGAYLGYTTAYGTFSIAGKHPYHQSDTPVAHRNNAQNRGEGYDLVSFYAYTLLQCLYLIKYKNLNSQMALGQGYTETNGASVTGATFDKGMYYGDPNDATVHVKFAGIEDIWGNLSWVIDGVRSKPVDLGGDNPVEIYTAFDNFTSYGTKFPFGDYKSVGVIAGDEEIPASYLKRPQGTTELGFLPKETGASSTMYFCDVVEARSGASRVLVGSSTSYKKQSGIFSIRISGREHFEYANATRIMYL